MACVHQKQSVDKHLRLSQQRLETTQMSTDRGMDRPAVYSRCGTLPSNEKAPVTSARDTDRCYRIPSASYYVKKVMQTVETTYTMVPFI